MTKNLCPIFLTHSVRGTTRLLGECEQTIKKKASTDNRKVITNLLFPCTTDSDDQQPSQHWSL